MNNFHNTSLRDILFTPGPWQKDWQFIVAPDPKGIHPDIYIAEIAETDEEGRIASPEQQEANGRLIVAAPKLAEILESLTDQISDLQGESSVIDEDLMQGEAFKEAIALLDGLKR